MLKRIPSSIKFIVILQIFQSLAQSGVKFFVCFAVADGLMIFLLVVAALFRVLDFRFHPDSFRMFWNLPTIARDCLILLRCGRVLVLHRRNVKSSASAIEDGVLLFPPDVADRFRERTFRSAPTFWLSSGWIAE